MVPGDLATRLEGAGLFLLSNFGFGLGFIKESLARPMGTELVELAEPARTQQR
jgi:hypothetical protein